MDSKEEYAFKKQLKKLKSLKGQGTELISIYIPPGYQVSEVTNKLREEAGQAMNIKSKQTRKNVTGAIERLLGVLKNMKKTPENGLVLFAGNLSREAGRADETTFRHADTGAARAHLPRNGFLTRTGMTINKSRRVI